MLSGILDASGCPLTPTSLDEGWLVRAETIGMPFWEGWWNQTRRWRPTAFLCR